MPPPQPNHYRSPAKGDKKDGGKPPPGIEREEEKEPPSQGGESARRQNGISRFRGRQTQVVDHIARTGVEAERPFVVHNGLPEAAVFVIRIGQVVVKDPMAQSLFLSRL